MSTKKAAKLTELMDRRALVRFETRFEQTPLSGYVLDVGPEFFLLACVSGDGWFDGLQAIRVADVRRLMVHPYARFLETALSLRGEVMPHGRGVSVGSVAKLLTTAGGLFPLVVVYQEELAGERCWVGCLVWQSQDEFAVVEIGPDATWESAETVFSAVDVTRVGFGGDYEEALAMVGGPRPIRVR